MACGKVHKASKSGFGNFMKRIGNGVRNGFNWLVRNREGINNAANAIGDVIGGRAGDMIRQGANYGNQALNIAGRIANV